MSTEIRALTNNYRDCRMVKLDANEPNSPVVIVQEGYAPGDFASRMRLFYLQRDGMWIDEVARSTRPDTELADVIFDTTTEAMTVLSSLAGKPMVRPVSVSEADVQAYLSRVKNVVSVEATFRELLARYRAAKQKR